MATESAGDPLPFLARATTCIGMIEDQKLLRDLILSGLSQREIAEKVGVARSLVSAWERGKREIAERYKPALRLLDIEARAEEARETVVRWR